MIVEGIALTILPKRNSINPLPASLKYFRMSAISKLHRWRKKCISPGAAVPLNPGQHCHLSKCPKCQKYWRDCPAKTKGTLVSSNYHETEMNWFGFWSSAWETKHTSAAIEVWKISTGHWVQHAAFHRLWLLCFPSLIHFGNIFTLAAASCKCAGEAGLCSILSGQGSPTASDRTFSRVSSHKVPWSSKPKVKYLLAPVFKVVNTRLPYFATSAPF